MGEMVDMEASTSDYRDKLDRHRVTVVQSLDLDRQFIFSYLRSNNILDEEDCQLITNSGSTRQQKNSKLLDVLSTRGEKAFTAFVEALEYELPSLYELFTGKKAAQSHHDHAKSRDMWGEFDREYLSKELVKVSEQYSTLTYMNEKVQKEKQLLEKELLDMTSQLNSSLKSQEELKFELAIQDGSQGVENYDQSEILNLMAHCQALVQENADKSNIIIALQARLLAVNEDRDGMNRHLEELQMKNKNLMQQVKDLTINYDFQRTRSIRLQEKFDMSNSELVRSGKLNRELHLNKFNLSQVTEEKEALANKLDEYRNVVTALNAKLCLLKEQKEVESEKRSEISEEYVKIRQQAKIYEMERDQRQSSSELLKEKVRRLELDVLSCREQMAFLSNELENTARERNRTIREREEVISYNNELLKSRDEAVRNQINISKKMEARYNIMTKQLDAANQELKNVMLENVRSSSSVDSRVKCEIFETELSNAKRNLRKSSIHRQVSITVSATTEPQQQKEKQKPSPLLLQQPPDNQQAMASDKSDVSRTTSVLDQAKAVLDGKSNSMDFSLNNRQLSWVYDSLKGNPSSFQAILNNPLVFPQFETDEEAEDRPVSSPGAEKRRIGSNRGMVTKTKRSLSNTTLETVKAIIPLPLSPQTRRRSLTPLI